ncbi:hypothetical protein MCERE1_02860 [Burkholderiaceae bacterium]
MKSLPMTSNTSKSGYLFYLNLIKLRDERQSHAAFELDAAAMRLLELIALDHLNLRPSSESGLTEIQPIGSVATVRENIHLLVDLGLIEQFFIGENKGTKYLRPTKLAIDYLGGVGQSMMKAV